MTSTIKELRQIGYQLQLISKGIVSSHFQTEKCGDLTICRVISNPEYYRLVEEWNLTHDDEGKEIDGYTKSK